MRELSEEEIKESKMLNRDLFNLSNKYRDNNVLDAQNFTRQLLFFGFLNVFEQTCADKAYKMDFIQDILSKSYKSYLKLIEEAGFDE